MRIHELLKEYRKKAGMTQEELANKLYIQRSAYTHYESGSRRVEAEMFFTILDILGVDVSMKDRTKYDWVLSYVESEEEDDASSVILSLYEEDGKYDINVYRGINGEKGELIQTGSVNSAQNERFDKESIEWIIEQEIKPKYIIKEVEYHTLGDVEVFMRKQRDTVFPMSISEIRHIFKKIIHEKTGENIDVVLDIEDDEEFLFGSLKAENQKEIIMEVLALSEDQYDEEMEMEFPKFILSDLIGKTIKRIRRDNEYYDMVWVFT